jgi:hypothetical protein
MKQLSTTYSDYDYGKILSLTGPLSLLCKQQDRKTFALKKIAI